MFLGRPGDRFSNCWHWRNLVFSFGHFGKLCVGDDSWTEVFILAGHSSFVYKTLKLPCNRPIEKMGLVACLSGACMMWMGF